MKFILNYNLKICLYSQKLNNNKENYPNKEIIIVIELSNNNIIIYLKKRSHISK